MQLSFRTEKKSKYLNIYMENYWKIIFIKLVCVDEEHVVEENYC